MQKGILWLVLTNESRTKLLNDVKLNYPNEYAHHVTLHYDTPLTPEYEKLVERSFTITAKAVAWNEQVQALTVELPPELSSQNKYPHITLSTREGIKPVASNDMLEGDHEEREIQLELEGRVEFKPF